MNLPTFTEFEAAALAEGPAEVVERRWDPGVVVPDHAHPFAVQALVVDGEMWLRTAGRERHLRAGDRFALAADEAHAERYGPAGAVYWVARRSRPAAGV